MAKKSVDRSIDEYKQLNEYLKEQLNIAKAINDINSQDAIQKDMQVQRQRTINDLKERYSELSKNEIKFLQELEAEQRKSIELEKQQNTQLEKQIKNRKFIVDLSRQLGAQLKIGWKYLQDQDKIIKSTVLNLGMSQAKAVAMRDAFEKSAGYVTRLGGTIADIQNVMEGYADETGRARVMSAEMVKDITAIGKGTGLGVEQATKLGAQFELMGFDAKTTMEYVQGVVDTSERMGVNTTKVLKNINDNFKRLNTYTFQQGVKGFAQMAMYAEKFKIDINQALNAADVARSLEGAIDLTAQLQIMGGEFAKTDPFEMLFLSRNDPAKFTEKIADMTKGVVSFRKMADGTFEKFISPADRDRLAAVAKSMGMEASELTQIAERQAEIQKMRQQMAGLGLSDEQKKLVEGAAIFDAKSGKFQVQIGETMKNIGELTGKQANAFVKEQKSLEERAKQAMTFNETFQAIIETLKASLLPILKHVNWLLDHTIKPIADLAAKGWGVGGAAAALISAGLLWKGVTNKLGNVVGKWVQGSGGKGISGMFGRVASTAEGGFAGGIPASGKGSSGLAQMRAGEGALAAGKGAGLKSLGTGAGVGAAAIGMGAGVGLAAVGISKLADSMSKLTDKQAKNLTIIATTLAVTFPLAAIGIALAGGAATATAPGLLALGAAVLMVGGAIGLAAGGIGFMGKGLAELVNAGKDAGPAMMQVGAGIGFVAMSMMGFTAGAAGFLIFAATMRTLSKNADKIAVIGNAFKNIQMVLSGSKDDFIAVENAVKSISSMNVKGGGYFAELSNLLRKPLQVEFANNGKVALSNDITLNLDGHKFMNKTYDVQVAIQKHEDLRHNKGT